MILSYLVLTSILCFPALYFHLMSSYGLLLILYLFSALLYLQYSPDLRQPHLQQQRQCHRTQGDAQEGLAPQVPPPPQAHRDGERWLHGGDGLLRELGLFPSPPPHAACPPLHIPVERRPITTASTGRTQQSCEYSTCYATAHGISQVYKVVVSYGESTSSPSRIIENWFFFVSCKILIVYCILCCSK